MIEIHEEKYIFQEPKSWVKQTSDQELLSNIVETDFSKIQLEEGRDYCYFLNKTIHVEDAKYEEYSCMAYTLNQPSNLERASVNEQILEENEVLLIHRLSIIRDGVLIDKLPDTKIKVLDSEDNSDGGVLNKTKKINFSIKDLRLYDVLIIEETRSKEYKDEDIIRKEFTKYVFITPDKYWAYGIYDFNFINNRTKQVAYKKFYFRNEKGELIDTNKEILNTGEKFQFLEKNYINPVDTNREIYPFIDFATESNWQYLSNFITPIYTEIINKNALNDFAPELKIALDEISDKEKQIQYAIEYVQNNIKYIYDANEMHGHKPQEASVTYNNKQGDCKAKTVLLKTILDYLNVESNIVLVNYRNDFYLKYYLPSLLSFNHVIIKINYNNKEYFIDATSVDEYGTLENRQFISFCNYLEIKENQELITRESFQYPKFCIDEKIDFNVKNNKGELTILTTYRYNRANNMRRYFKNTNKREIIDGWLNYLFGNLNYHNDRNGEDVRKIFENVELGILQDNKDSNEVQIRFYSTINNPYFTDKTGKRFLMFFDHNILKYNVRDFNHQDITFWHGFDSEKYEISLKTDEKIDTTEKYTVQECNINNPYFTHFIKKDISKNQGKAFIEYNPVANLEIPTEDLVKLKEDYLTIHDSNFGLGIDIIESGFFNQIKFSFKKIMG